MGRRSLSFSSFFFTDYDQRYLRSRFSHRFKTQFHYLNRRCPFLYLKDSVWHLDGVLYLCNVCKILQIWGKFYVFSPSLPRSLLERPELGRGGHTKVDTDTILSLLPRKSSLDRQTWVVQGDTTTVPVLKRRVGVPTRPTTFGQRVPTRNFPAKWGRSWELLRDQESGRTNGPVGGHPEGLGWGSEREEGVFLSSTTW